MPSENILKLFKNEATELKNEYKIKSCNIYNYIYNIDSINFILE